MGAVDPHSAQGHPVSLLVGRERELDTLRERFARALTGHGSLVLIGGEAGIGKTALTELLCREVETQGAFVFVGRCYDRSETPPYGPFLELFRTYRRENGLPPAPFSHWRGTGDAGSQAALYEQILAFFHDVACQRPLVLLFDDLHWADRASLDLLRVLARSLPAWRVLALATYRADELTRHHPLYALLPLLEREAPVIHVFPRPLDRKAIVALVRHRYPLPDEDTERLVAYLGERTEGNPLFVAQLLRALEEQDILRRDRREWRLGAVDNLGIPVSLLQLIDARLARLDEGTRDLLGMAAVVGQEVALRMWAATAGTDENAVVAAAAAASAIGLIEIDGDGAQMRFVHALIRECIFEGIFPPRRRVLHRRVAEVLAAVPAADPDVVAYHFARGGDARALEWLVQAGERARRANADHVAIDRFGAALALMDRECPDDRHQRAWLLVRIALAHRFEHPEQSVAHLREAARIAAQCDEPALTATARYHLGLTHCFTGDLAQGVAEMEAGLAAFEALPVSEQRHVADLLAMSVHHWRGTLILYLAASGNVRRAVTLEGQGVPGTLTSGSWYLGLLIAQALLGRPDAAAEPFRRACGLERAGRNDRQLGFNYLLHLELVALTYYPDDLDARKRLAEEGERAWRQARVTYPDSQPPRIAWLPLLLITGEWEELARLIPTVGVPNASHEAVVLSVVGQFARLRGDAEGAWRQVHAVLPHGTATEPGDRIFFVAQQMQRLAAVLALDDGDLAVAHHWLEAHDRWLTWSGAALGQSEGQALWARYYEQGGDRAKAGEHAERALVYATEPRQPLALLATHRLLGTLDTDAGRYQKADGHLQMALTLADACQASYERALTLLALAALRAVTGDVVAAHALCSEAQTICVSLGARPALTRITALLTTLAVPALPEATYPAGLSAREVEVLRYLAAGHTNRAIAEALSLSEHTVRAHLRHIFAKTESDNRTAAAAFARRHGLA